MFSLFVNLFVVLCNYKGFEFKGEYNKSFAQAVTFENVNTHVLVTLQHEKEENRLRVVVGHNAYVVENKLELLKALNVCC